MVAVAKAQGSQKTYKTEIIARAQATKLGKKTGLLYEVLAEDNGFAVRQLSVDAHQLAGAAAKMEALAPTEDELKLHREGIVQLISSNVPAANEFGAECLAQLDMALKDDEELQTALVEVNAPAVTKFSKVKKDDQLVTLTMPCLGHYKNTFAVEIGGVKAYLYYRHCEKFEGHEQVTFTTPVSRLEAQHIDVQGLAA